MSNEFWAFSLKMYRFPEVDTHCLALQEASGVDVNVVLYAIWLAVRNEKLSTVHLQAVENCVHDWRHQVVLPLRELRVNLRSVASGQEIRTGVKALELQAEKDQQDMMWEFYQASDALESIAFPLNHNLNQTGASDQPQQRAWQKLAQRVRAAQT